MVRRIVPSAVLCAFITALSGCSEPPAYNDRPAARWLEDLDAGDPGCEWALETLAESHTSVRDEIVRRVRNRDDEKTCILAMRIYARAGRYRQWPSDDLADALVNGSVPIQMAAVRALGDLRPADERAVEALGTALTHESWSVRYKAATALGCVQHERAPWLGPRAAKLLVGALADKDDLVRWHAAEGLLWIGAPAIDAVPALIIALRDEERHVRYYSAAALGRIGIATREVTIALEAATHDKDGWVADSARMSLEQLRQGTVKRG